MKEKVKNCFVCLVAYRKKCKRFYCRWIKCPWSYCSWLKGKRNCIAWYAILWSAIAGMLSWLRFHSVCLLGLLSAGCFSIGVFATGAISLGIISLGAIAIGDFSVGALSIGKYFALGDNARAMIALGDTEAEEAFFKIGEPFRKGYYCRKAIARYGCSDLPLMGERNNQAVFMRFYMLLNTFNTVFGYIQEELADIFECISVLPTVDRISPFISCVLPAVDRHFYRNDYNEGNKQ